MRRTDRARQLRRAMTDAERKLWHELRGRRLQGAKFRRQEQVGRHFADFLCFERRLIVEVDGGQHSPEADAARTAALESDGWRVVRYWNHEVMDNLDGVLADLSRQLRVTRGPSSNSD